jgi:hypothetical protein
VTIRLILAAMLLSFAAPALAGPPATLADAEFITGAWVGEGIAGAEAGETWSPAAGGQMVGHFYQLQTDGAVMFYELITLAPDGEGSLVMRLKHFAPDLAGWEAQEAEAAEAFPLTAVGEDRLEFSGLIYQLLEDGSLKVSVVTQTSSGDPETLEFLFRRAAD